jgi:hypothetical protein
MVTIRIGAVGKPEVKRSSMYTRKIKRGRKTRR